MLVAQTQCSSFEKKIMTITIYCFKLINKQYTTSLQCFVQPLICKATVMISALMHYWFLISSHRWKPKALTNPFFFLFFCLFYTEKGWQSRTVCSIHGSRFVSVSVAWCWHSHDTLKTRWLNLKCFPPSSAKRHSTGTQSQGIRCEYGEIQEICRTQEMEGE